MVKARWEVKKVTREVVERVRYLKLERPSIMGRPGGHRPTAQ